MSTRLIAFRVFMALGLALVLAAPAGAVISNSIRADIPFDFAVGGKMMPSGRYSIEPTANAATLQIMGETGHSALLTLQFPLERVSGSRPELIFDRSAGIPRLAGVRYSAPNRAMKTTAQ